MKLYEHKMVADECAYIAGLGWSSRQHDIALSELPHVRKLLRDAAKSIKALAKETKP